MTAVFHPAPPDAVLRLREVSMLASLGDEDLESLAGELEWLMLPGGDTLFSQGDAAADMYFVLSGRLGVFRVHEEGDELLAELSRGAQLGELALLTGNPRSATIRALRDTELARLSQASFEHLMQMHPRAHLSLARLLAMTLAPDAARAETVLSAVALVPLGPIGVAFARALEERMPAGCTAISARDMDEILGSRASASRPGEQRALELVGLLHDIERKHRMLILVGDTEPSEWTETCLRQSDRVMVIADASQPTSLGAHASTFERWQARDVAGERQLVLVHPPDTGLPSGTRDWLALHDFGRHHHVRRGDAADTERVVRHLTGRSLNLVLGGGGARAFTHVGVLQALADAGIPVDAIGGASMGAVVGAGYAMTQDLAFMHTMAEGFRRARIQRELTLPMVSLLSTRRAHRLYERLFGDVHIEDLWLPYFCVTANLTRNRLAVHRSGPLRPVALAGASPPGIWPPMIHGDELHVDGGLLNNMPTDIMRADRAGRIVAVDVSRQSDMRAPAGSTRAPSGWRLLWHTLNPFKRKLEFPNIYQIIYSAAAIAGEAHEGQARQLAEVYLEPPVTHFGIGDYGQVHTMMAMGREFGEQHSARITEVFERDMGPKRRVTMARIPTVGSGT